MEPSPRSHLILRHVAALAVPLLFSFSCREREAGSQTTRRSDSLPAGIATDSVPTRLDSARQTPQDSVSSIQSLRWPEPSSTPELAEILRRSAQLVDVKRRLDDLDRISRNAPGQASSRGDSSTSVDIPFEDSLSAWIGEYGAFLAKPSTASAWPVQADLPIDVFSDLATQLPKVAPSKFFDGRSVFFVGGAPLLSKDIAEGGAAFVDLEGKPEFRYSTSLNGASEHLVTAMRSIPGTRLEVQSGPPLVDYESGPYGVGGIGSLDHVAKTPLRAWLLTASGPVPARVVSVRHNLFRQDICVSHLPRAVFASAAIPGEAIFGIYFPRDGLAPPRSIIAHRGKLTTVDLDGDGIPEFAAVVEPFQGVASDELDRAAWFVNASGTWKPIDAGSHEDCT